MNWDLGSVCVVILLAGWVAECLIEQWKEKR